MDNKCLICGSKLLLEEHHTIPRSLGGHNSELVTLCKLCHNYVHQVAKATVASNPKVPPDVLFLDFVRENPEADFTLFKELVRRIVDAWYAYQHQKTVQDKEATATIQLSIPKSIYPVVKQAAKDANLSIPAFILYCVEKELRRLGWQISLKS